MGLDGFATTQQLHSKKHKAPTGAGALMILWLQLYMLMMPYMVYRRV